MARDPDDHDAAYEILAEHIVITEGLHGDAKSLLAAAIRIAVEAWLDDEADEYRNSTGEP